MVAASSSGATSRSGRPIDTASFGRRHARVEELAVEADEDRHRGRIEIEPRAGFTAPEL